MWEFLALLVAASLGFTFSSLTRFIEKSRKRKIIRTSIFLELRYNYVHLNEALPKGLSGNTDYKVFTMLPYMFRRLRTEVFDSSIQEFSLLQPQEMDLVARAYYSLLNTKQQGVEYFNLNFDDTKANASMQESIVKELFGNALDSFTRIERAICKLGHDKFIESQKLTRGVVWEEAERQVKVEKRGPKDKV